MTGTPSIRSRSIPGLAAVVLAACHAAPPPPPVMPAAPVVRPHVATGTYDLTTTLPGRQPPAPRGRAAAPPAATLELAPRPLAMPDATAQSNTQLSATVNLPGYTRAPRGRTGQAAAWWPLPGDSVVVHFQPPQGTGLIDLRGRFQGDTLAGDVWYTALGTGASFQMGTFKAIKRRR